MGFDFVAPLIPGIIEWGPPFCCGPGHDECGSSRRCIFCIFVRVGMASTVVVVDVAFFCIFCIFCTRGATASTVAVVVVVDVAFFAFFVREGDGEGLLCVGRRLRGGAPARRALGTRRAS